MGALHRKPHLMQFAAALMAVKTLLPYSSVIPFSDLVDNLLLVAALACFCMVLLFQGLNREEFLRSLLVGVGAVVTCLIIDDFSILITAIAVFSLRKYDIKRFVEVIFWVQLVFCLFHVVWAVFYAITVSHEPYMLVSAERRRFTFGFVHPNMFAVLVLSLLMMWLWLYPSKRYPMQLIGAAAIVVGVYLFINTRTFLITGLVGLGLLYWVYLKNPRSILRTLVRWVIPALAGSMLVLMLLFNAGSGIANLANKILNSRVHLGAYAFKELGISLLGQKVPFYDYIDPSVSGLTTFTFDNIYSYLLVQGGVVWLVLLSLAYFRMSRRVSSVDCVMLLIWAIYGMCENVILNGYILFPVFLTATALRRSGGKRRKRRGANEL